MSPQQNSTISIPQGSPAVVNIPTPSQPPPPPPTPKESVWVAVNIEEFASS